MPVPKSGTTISSTVGMRLTIGPERTCSTCPVLRDAMGVPSQCKTNAIPSIIPHDAKAQRKAPRVFATGWNLTGSAPGVSSRTSWLESGSAQEHSTPRAAAAGVRRASAKAIQRAVRAALFTSPLLFRGNRYWSRLNRGQKLQNRGQNPPVEDLLAPGAGEGNRTLDIQLGKLSFYH
jgi:hypothetical protein